MQERGELIPEHVSKGGTRYYSAEQLKLFSSKAQNGKIVAGYCRVSTPAQKEDLQTQISHVKAYMIAKGYQFEIITDIRTNHIHQTTAEIVKAKPSRIVMETLKVTGMMKNRHLSRAVAQQKFYEFKRQIRYKSALHGIAFAEADCRYPSSKKCSCCGTIKTDLKLSDRTYRCKKCGLSIDRDFNASINLANYKSV